MNFDFSSKEPESLDKNIIIQTMARDEDHIINEFIVHHFLLGVEHIYIYDDNSLIHISEKIKELPLWIQQKITVYRLDDSNNFYNEDSFKQCKYYNEDIYKKCRTRKQLYFMNYFLVNHKKNSKWCLFLDSDEFIYLKNYENINDFLKTFDNFDSIYIPWIYYGTSYHIDQPDGLVIENFTYHINKYANCGKSVVKMKSLDKIECVHKMSQILKPSHYKFNDLLPLYELPIHINHYITNSVKTYIKRKLRNNIGQPNGTIRNPANFYHTLCDCNGIKDNIMNKYIDNVNSVLKKERIKEEKNNENVYNLFKNKDDIIISCETNEQLKSILYDNTIEYCSKNDLQLISDAYKKAADAKNIPL